MMQNKNIQSMTLNYMQWYSHLKGGDTIYVCKWSKGLLDVKLVIWYQDQKKKRSLADRTKEEEVQVQLIYIIL